MGRDAEMVEGGKLVSDNRLVTLTGAGGDGKTRLAVQVAAELLDGTGDGVWLVELASVTDSGAVPFDGGERPGRGRAPGPSHSDTLVDVLGRPTAPQWSSTTASICSMPAPPWSTRSCGTARGSTCWPPAASRCVSMGRSSTESRPCPCPLKTQWSRPTWPSLAP